MSIVVGWDIGGVHLKAARAENGRIVAAIQVASPLRGGLERLIEAFAEAKAAMGTPELHAVTMTGELADTFSSRAEGVARLVALAAQKLWDAPVRFYAGPAGFSPPGTGGGPRYGDRVGQLARQRGAGRARARTALFVDMGSTTTDIVPVRDGAVAARGYSDAERLAAGELVYTGLVRSFLMATADRAPFAGVWTPLINENFANMADVHRILGTLPDGADQMTTADGREKTVDASRARLARMVGRDADDADDAAWTALARWFAEAQMRAVTDAAMLVLSDAQLPAEGPIVAAGAGSGIVNEIARRLYRSHVAFDSLLDMAPEVRDAASQCAPAAALALLGTAEVERLE